MLKPTVIEQASFEQDVPLYINALGESFFMSEMFAHLQFPFYAATCYDKNGTAWIVAAFQEKKDLVEWLNQPFLK